MTGDTKIIPSKVHVKLRIGGQSIKLTNEQTSQCQRLVGTMTMSFYARLAASPQYVATLILGEINNLAKL